MKKIVFTAAIMCFAAFTTLSAQDDKGDKGAKGDKDKKETQEIIIRKKGQKDAKISVEINGDKVTINGKPLSEFKDDEITINKRNIICIYFFTGSQYNQHQQSAIEIFYCIHNRYF